MRRNDEITEEFKRAVKLLRDRGEDNDTIIAITCGCIEMNEDLDEFCDWLEAHPEANHDTLFRYALETYAGIDVDQ